MCCCRALLQFVVEGEKSPVKTRPRRGVVTEEAPAKEEDQT